MSFHTITASTTRRPATQRLAVFHLGFGLLFCLTSLVSAADLLKWDVTGSTGTSSGPAPSTPSAGVSGTAITSGPGTTAGNSTSPANTWNRAFPNPGSEDAALALEAGNYFSFTTTAAPGYTVSVSGIGGMKLSRTSNGATSAALFYSNDGVNFTQTGTDFTTSTTLTSPSTQFSATISVTPIVITGGNTVHWRVAAWGGTGGRLGFGKVDVDDIILLGSSVSDVPVHNLLWTGTGGNAWNQTPANTNWADTDLANAAAPFITGDNVTINIPATIAVDAAGVSAGNITVSNPSGTVDINNGSITGLILTKSGAGTLSLVETNTFSGGVLATGGTLQLESDIALGTAAASIDGASLKTTSGALSIANNIAVGNGGAVIDTDADVNFSGQINSFDAAINASHVVTKIGAGILTLSKTGTSALGAQTVIESAGGMVELDITAGGIVFSGTGQRNLGGTNTWDGPVTLAGGTLMLHGGTVTGTGPLAVTANSTISSRLNFGIATMTNAISVDSTRVLSVDSANGNNALALGSAISGDGALTKIGNGTVRIEGTNSYAGTTTINAGTLRIGTGTNGTLGTGSVIITAGTLLLNRDDSVTIPNQISGAGNLNASAGAGVTTLTGDNTYTGVTSCTEGDLGATVIADGDANSSIGASSSDAANLILNGGNLVYVGSTAASTNRAFTLGITGGGISATGLGSVHFTDPSSIVLPDPTAVTVGALTVGTSYKIVSTGDTDFTLIGAADSNPGTTFVATGSGTGTGSVVYANHRQFRLRGSTLATNILDCQIDDGTNAPTMLAKNGATTWSITAANTYTGSTTITSGILKIDGNSPATTGPILVAGGALGGNGLTGGAVTIQSGGGLDVRITDWIGAPGTGYHDLAVASLDAAAVPMTVTIDASGLANFTDSGKSFTILNTSGGITNFNPANVTVTAPGFPGTGYWTLAQSGNALVLTYALGGNFSTWATANGIGGEPATGDFDKDGLTNFVEYALGLNPTASSVPPGTFNGGTLSFTKGIEARANGDVTYEIEQSTTLGAWTVVVPHSPASPTISHTLPAGQPRQFARLRITQIP